jgi:hypothetical protein
MVGLQDIVVMFVVAVVESVETTATRKSNIRAGLCFVAVNTFVSPEPDP